MLHVNDSYEIINPLLFPSETWKRTSRLIVVVNMLELSPRERKFFLHSLASCWPSIFNLSFSLKWCFSETSVSDKCDALIPEAVTTPWKSFFPICYWYLNLVHLGWTIVGLFVIMECKIKDFDVQTSDSPESLLLKMATLSQTPA